VTRVVVLSPEELVELVREAVAAALGGRAHGADDRVPLAAAGVPVRTLRKAIKAGELVAVRAGRSYFVRRADLDAWLTAQKRFEPRQKPEAPKSEADRAIERARRSGALRPVRAA
jgi:excisionase family DNA binding protein